MRANLRRHNRVYVLSSKHNDRPMRAHLLPYFSYSQYPASRSFLSVLPFVFSWSFDGCLLFPKTAMKVLRKIQLAKRCRRTLLAGYSITGFAPLYFPCPQRPIFNWLTDQTIKLLSISVSFLSVFIFPSYRSSYM